MISVGREDMVARIQSSPCPVAPLFICLGSVCVAMCAIVCKFMFIYLFTYNGKSAGMTSIFFSGCMTDRLVHLMFIYWFTYNGKSVGMTSRLLPLDSVLS